MEGQDGGRFSREGWRHWELLTVLLGKNFPVKNCRPLLFAAPSTSTTLLTKEEATKVFSFLRPTLPLSVSFNRVEDGASSTHYHRRGQGEGPGAKNVDVLLLHLTLREIIGKVEVERC